RHADLEICSAGIAHQSRTRRNAHSVRSSTHTVASILLLRSQTVRHRMPAPATERVTRIVSCSSGTLRDRRLAGASPTECGPDFGLDIHHPPLGGPLRDTRPWIGRHASRGDLILTRTGLPCRVDTRPPSKEADRCETLVVMC